MVKNTATSTTNLILGHVVKTFWTGVRIIRGRYHQTDTSWERFIESLARGGRICEGDQEIHDRWSCANLVLQKVTGPQLNNKSNVQNRRYLD